MVDLLAPGRDLATGVEAALPAWVERSVDRVHRAVLGPPPPMVVDAAGRAGVAARDEVGARLRALLETDVDEQTTTPLAVVRQAVAYPTRVLAEAGVPPATRDARDREMFPDDPYGLTPANFADIDPRLNDLAIAWGAAKAWVHKQRHAP